MKPPFPEFIDSTSRKDFVACGQKFNYSSIRHLKARGQSPHLVFGGAYAKGLETFRLAYYGDGKSFDEAFQLGAIALHKEFGDYEPPQYGSGANKTLPACFDVYASYWEEYHPDTDFLKPLATPDGPAVEFSFAIPIPKITHPESGAPLLYAGRFDMLAESDRGAVFVHDDKTAGQLGDSWASTFKLSSQLTGYSWACREYGYRVRGVSVRGVAALKTMVKHQAIMAYRPDWMIDRWLVQLQRDLRRAIKMWKEDRWDMALDDSCTAYAGCPYRTLCTSPEPEKWIETEYEINPWNPLAKD